MKTGPVNYFYCHLFPTGVMVPDNTAVANIAKIPVPPCVTTEDMHMPVRQLEVSGGDFKN